ncbi:MAG: O-antigen ligase family protein [Bacteroidia bacterium]|nr:O-antigen ligase family protein [Bacteroidia bacterium]
MNPILNKKASLGSYLVGAYLFSVPAFSYSETMNLTFIPQVIAALVVMLAIFDITKTGKFNLSADIKLYGYFVLWTVIAFILAGDWTYGESLLTLIKIGFIVLAVSQLIKNEKDFLMAITIFNFSIVLVYYFNQDLIGNLQKATKVTGDDRFAGTLTNSNVAAMYALSILWSGIILLFSTQTKTVIKVITILTVAVALWIIVFSGSKKGLIGVVLFALFTGWLFIQKNKHSFWKLLLASILALALISLTLYYVYNSPFFDRMQTMVNGDTHSTAHRIYLINAAIDTWLDSGKTFLAGVGHENFKDMNLLGKYSHSTITETLVASGIIGFVLYFGSLFFLIRKFNTLRNLTLGSRHFSTAFFCLMHILLFLFFNTAAVMYDSRDFWPLMAVMSSYGMYISKLDVVNPLTNLI